MHDACEGVEFLWSVCLSVCLSVRWDSISSQVLEPIGMKLGRMIKGMHENVTKKKFLDLLMLTGVRPVGHRCLF